MSIEERILDLPAFADYQERRELRAIALNVRKLEDRVKQLEGRIDRAAKSFFQEGSDRQIASGMLAILEEERNKQ